MDMRDLAMLEGGVAQLKAMPVMYEAIKLACFSKAEANKWERYTAARWPEIKFYFTWMEFKGGTPQ